MTAGESAKRKRKALEAVEPPLEAAIDLGTLPRQLGYVLRRAQAAVIQSYAGAFAEAGPRPAQFAVLTILDRNPGLSPSQVAGVLAINRTNFVPLFDSLVQRGLATRRPVKSNRRAHALYLTAAGKALFDKAARRVNTHEQLFAAKLGDGDLERLLELLHRLTGALADNVPPA